MTGGGAWSPASVSRSRPPAASVPFRRDWNLQPSPTLELATLCWSLRRNMMVTVGAKRGGGVCTGVAPPPLPMTSHVPCTAPCRGDVTWLRQTEDWFCLHCENLPLTVPSANQRRPPPLQAASVVVALCLFCVAILNMNFTTDSNIFLWRLRVVRLFIYLLLVKWCKWWLTGDCGCEISFGCSCSLRSSTPFGFYVRMRKETDSSKNENVCAIIYEYNLFPAQHHSCWFYFWI